MLTKVSYHALILTLGITYPDDQYIGGIGLDRDEISLGDCDVVPINPELIRQKTASVHESKFVFLALFKYDFVSLMLSCTTRICGWVAVKNTFAIQDGRHRKWCVW